MRLVVCVTGEEERKISRTSSTSSLEVYLPLQVENTCSLRVVQGKACDLPPESR